jgi:predicted TIM-barrel fold metal-dependent hydrolase
MEKNNNDFDFLLSNIENYVLLNKNNDYYIFTSDLISMVAIDVDEDIYNYIIEQMLAKGIRIIENLEEDREKKSMSIDNFFNRLKKLE